MDPVYFRCFSQLSSAPKLRKAYALYHRRLPGQAPRRLLKILYIDEKATKRSLERVPIG